MKSIGPQDFVVPTPVWCIGSYDADGRPNVMTAAWGGICCSVPPCVGVSLRKATYSYGNIMAKKAFTVSVPSQAHVAQADYVGLPRHSGKDEDKFAATGLTPVRAEKVDAPYVKEFPLVLECQVVHTAELGLHTHFVGEVLDIKLADGMFDGEGNPDIEKIQPLIFTPKACTYRAVGAFVGQGFSIGKQLEKER